jgi:hypothetical protein
MGDERKRREIGDEERKEFELGCGLLFFSPSSYK